MLILEKNNVEKIKKAVKIVFNQRIHTLYLICNCKVTIFFLIFPQDLSAVATVPDQYPLLVELKCINSILELLSHDNTDVSTKVVNLLQVTLACYFSYIIIIMDLSITKFNLLLYL